MRERIGLNFIRPDVNRPGNHDFINSGVFLVSQFKQLGVKWNRLAFSWVLIQPKKGEYNWTPYDQIVDVCRKEGINILATIGGHFDNPSVPTWAGNSLAEVVRVNPKALEGFVESLAQRYRKYIHHWEVFNEPASFHKGLTVMEYIEKILKPSYNIIKSIDSKSKVLPCSYRHLPAIGNKEDFWNVARGYYDIQNIHIYVDWGKFRKQSIADKEIEEAKRFRELMVKYGEEDKNFWITEIGWWGTASITGSIYEFYKEDPISHVELKPFYTGREILEHPIVNREDSFRAEWMKDLFPRILSVPGCEKVFLWASMDEFEGGYDPNTLYGRSMENTTVRQVDLWGIIAGDRTWRKSALALSVILKKSP
ncbi:MAG: family 1 glycosylhydrolase [Candidatus Bathyarchaeia archaeon]